MEEKKEYFGTATENQLNFINTLLEERGMDDVSEIGWDEEMLEHEKFGKGRASQLIKELLSIPK
jgi:hypothetical protein